MTYFARIFIDFYWWWAAALLFFLSWDLYQKHKWTAVLGVVLSRVEHIQSSQPKEEDDLPIPFVQQPDSSKEDQSQTNGIKATVTVEYEFTVEGNNYQSQKTVESYQKNSKLKQLFDQEEIVIPAVGEQLQVYYNPKNPDENLLTKTPVFGIHCITAMGMICLILGLLFQLPL